jgi:hypothetical protein
MKSWVRQAEIWYQMQQGPVVLMQEEGGVLVMLLWPFSRPRRMLTIVWPVEL